MYFHYGGSCFRTRLEMKYNLSLILIFASSMHKPNLQNIFTFSMNAEQLSLLLAYLSFDDRMEFSML